MIGPEHKSFPPSAWGSTAEQFLATGPTLADFQTPLLTLTRDALDANTAVMSGWLGARSLQIAPHGKTTMAPQLWRDLLDAGAWGITLATPWQVQLGRAHGLERIMLANSLVDPVALAWLAEELRDPAFEFVCWVDNARTVELMTAALGELPRPVEVIIELGSPGARTGARSIDEAVRVADAVRESPSLTVRGVGGYEGSIAHDRSEKSLEAVRTWLGLLLGLHERLRDHYDDREPIVTAGGSAYVELVAEALEGVDGIPLLRSGAYQVHDDGFYDSISPLPLRSAMHGWARVVSRPEPGLALLDGGRRDFPWDEGMPVALDIPESQVTALNDQHAFLRLPASAELAIGDVVRLGLSHPCSALDRWTLIPVIASTDDPRVVDVIRTFF
ncbi:amino acid deaminase [Glaciihabitans arcticus]|uniref:Amino acid deaminase n=1 Tax=Glaciihabitans arcticus TaxID=2668039 RepID=A0A4Q9H174_9MICO|nr:alanine racemase [Glaciihabitans arcticus]TBN58470.1 amino acid deaminase [Glaciihabitans arcticus]